MALLENRKRLTLEEFFILFQILDNTSNSIVVTDTLGLIQYVNVGFEKLTGYKKEEVLGKNANIVKSGKTKLATYKKIWKTISERKTWAGTLSNKKKNGQLFWAKAVIFPVFNKEGKITHFVSIQTDITKEKKVNERLIKSKAKLKLLSVTDELTGLFNFREFERRLRREVDEVTRYSGSLSLVSFDLDNFKVINDTYGHPVGDIVLKLISESVKTIIRKTDSFCRVGGEEFSIIFPHLSLHQAIDVAEKIRKKCENLHIDNVGSITISIGVAQYRKDEGIEDFKKRTDGLMYKAKKEGKNRTCS